MSLRRRTLLASAAAFLAAPPAARAEPGVSADQILFGQAAAFDGPAAALGLGMRAGIEAAFAEANRAGGVQGRKLALATANDGYEPTRSIEAVRKLLNEDKVFALIGPVGTPTSAATQPIAAEAGAPFIGPFTGAEFLRDPKRGNVVNVRASYFQETEAMVERLTTDLQVKRIAIFYQDDAYGRAGLDGLKAALGRRQMELVAEGTYARNTTAVKGAVVTIRKGNPEAVVMVGAYKPCADFIRLCRQVKLAAVFINISFVGSEALAQELGPEGDGVVVTQVVPLPHEPALPVVAAYQAALHAHAPDTGFGFVSLEGYLVGRLAAAALGRLAGEPTRAALQAVFAHETSFDLGGMTLRYGPQRNFGSDAVFLTMLQADGKFRQLTTLPRLAG